MSLVDGGPGVLLDLRTKRRVEEDSMDPLVLHEVEPRLGRKGLAGLVPPRVATRGDRALDRRDVGVVASREDQLTLPGIGEVELPLGVLPERPPLGVRVRDHGLDRVVVIDATPHVVLGKVGAGVLLADRLVGRAHDLADATRVRPALGVGEALPPVEPERDEGAIEHLQTLEVRTLRKPGVRPHLLGEDERNDVVGSAEVRDETSLDELTAHILGAHFVVRRENRVPQVHQPCLSEGRCIQTRRVGHVDRAVDAIWSVTVHSGAHRNGRPTRGRGDDERRVDPTVTRSVALAGDAEPGGARGLTPVDVDDLELACLVDGSNQVVTDTPLPAELERVAGDALSLVQALAREELLPLGDRIDQVLGDIQEACAPGRNVGHVAIDLDLTRRGRERNARDGVRNHGLLIQPHQLVNHLLPQHHDREDRQYEEKRLEVTTHEEPSMSLGTMPAERTEIT